MTPTPTRSQSESMYFDPRGGVNAQAPITFALEELIAADTIDAPPSCDSILVTIRFRPLSEREFQRGDEIAWYADGDKIFLGFSVEAATIIRRNGRKETVLDLAKFVDKSVQVKLTGGRQVTGTLKGYDQLLNLVLDEAVEFLRDVDDPLKTTDQTRHLGLIYVGHALGAAGDFNGEVRE